MYEELERVHFEQLHHYIQHALDIVVNEHELSDGGNFEDDIDRNTYAADRSKDILVCTVCGSENARRKLICEGCKRRDGLKAARTLRKLANPSSEKSQPASVVTEEMHLQEDEEQSEKSQHARYQHIPSAHRGATELTVGMPTFLNPNSSESVTLIMRHIGIACGVSRYESGEREWSFVCCDGRPHSLYHKILDEALICNLCGSSFSTRSDYRDHHKMVHEERDPSCSREFDWVYLRIGGGHYEMNVMKAYFELNWKPFLEKMCELMGFTSDNAKHFAKTCKDHHVAWQLLLTFHTSALQEMVVPYVRSIRSTEETATVSGFFRFYKQSMASNTNAAYLQLQVFRFSQAIINFRMGMRRNNSQLVKSAQFYLKELFYGRCHPHYQNIELFDCIQYKFMPVEVKAVWDKNVSFSTSGDSSKGQDLDFLLEEKNKAIKQYLPSGSIPSDETWRSICCNLKFFENIQEKLTKLLGLEKVSDYGTKTVDVQNAITAFRPVVRHHLVKNHDQLLSLSGEKLHPDLANFLELATLKRIDKINSDILGEERTTRVTEPVFITKEEANNYKTKLSRPELAELIRNMLFEMPEDELRHHYSTVFDSLDEQTSSKSAYLTLYYELKDITSRD